MRRSDCEPDANANRNAARAVLVTGASTGIGRKIVEDLAAAGHRVYAGARKEWDLRALAAIENVTSLRLDVTSPRDISAAASRVTDDDHGLYGLVNNAGVATLGTVTEGSVQEFELTMTVNAIAPYLLTRAFVPLIRAAHGRIVMIGSIAGILAERNLSAYSMSKHALEALTDALAAEMEPHGVHVSIVEPGVFSTELASNFQQRIGDLSSVPDLSRSPEPYEVARAVLHALVAARPKRRYLVVSSADEARQTIAKQIQQLVQLNDGHAYTYRRDELLAMLDAELQRLGAGSSPEMRRARHSV